MKHRQDMVDLLAATIKDQLDNPIYAVVRYGNSREAMVAAADAALAQVEAKLKTPWDRLQEIFCPAPRISAAEYHGTERKNEHRQR